MDTAKKYCGIIWLLAGIVLAIYLPFRAVTKLSSPTATPEDFVFWIVIVAIFIPILAGFILFGYYAFKGEYNNPKV